MKKVKRKQISQADKQEWMLGLFALIMTTLAVMALRNDMVWADKKETRTILIDPGHGGYDPGKIGVENQVEKDINLAISLLLEKELKKEGFQVALTRKEDVCATGEKKDSKARDMNARIDAIKRANADVCISIHQNSFETGEAKGAQVFFYKDSVEGRRLAELLQESLKKEADPENQRGIKPDHSYYILRHSKVPTVIVECGFLSNREEAQKLTKEEYQKQIVTGIMQGIIQYFGD